MNSPSTLTADTPEMLMGTLYLTEQYSTVKLEGDALRVHYPAGHAIREAGRVVRIPLLKVEQVVIFGEITLTTPAIHALLERKIAIHYLSAYGKSYGAVTADWGKNSGVRLAQYQLFSNHEQRFAAAQACIAGKLLNMRTTLQRYARNRESDPRLDDAIFQLRQALHTLERLTPLPVEPTDRMNGLGALLGLEGSASAAYYGVFDLLLKGDWEFSGRVKRPPTDPVNALLSFGYTVLTNQIVSLIHAVGLDPGIGVLHQPGFGKPALALDIIEAFRPIIVDSVVLTMINTGQLTPSDFTEELGAYRLDDQARNRFLGKLEERLNERVKHPIFGYQTSYRRCIELQIRLFAKYAQGEIDHYTPFTVR